LGEREAGQAGRKWLGGKKGRTEQKEKMRVPEVVF